MGRHKKQPPIFDNTDTTLDGTGTVALLEQEPRTSEGEIVPDDDEEDDTATLDKISVLQREVSQLKKELAWAYKNMTLNESVAQTMIPDGQPLSIQELNQLGRKATQTGQYEEAIQAHESFLQSGLSEHTRYVAQALDALRKKQAKANAPKPTAQPNTLQQFTRR